MAALTGLSGASGLSAVAGGVAMVPWLPTMEPSLRLWIDPRTASTYTVDGNGELQQIRSRHDSNLAYTRTNGAATVSSGAFIPSGFAIFEAPSRLGFPADPEFIFCTVATPSAVATDSILLSLGDTDAGRTVVQIGTNAYGFIGSRVASFPSQGSQRLVTAVSTLSGIKARMREDGTELVATASASGATPAATNVSRFIRNFQGQVRQSLLFASTSQTLIERAEGFLAHAEGRTAQLPANHPFKFSPPMVPAPS